MSGTEGKVIALMGPSVACVSQAGFRTFRQHRFYSRTQDGTAPVGLLRHEVRRAVISEGLRQEAGEKLRVTIISPGFVRTNFAESVTHSEVKAQIEESRDKFAMPPDAIARAIAFAIEQPADVDVSELVLHPIAQG